jgi:hypothetical protein
VAKKASFVMKNRYPSPGWLDLFLIVGGFLGAFWLVVRAPLTETGHILCEAGLVLLLWWLLFRWLNENEAAFLDHGEKGTRHLFNSKPDSSDLISPEPSLTRFARRTGPAWLAAVLSFIGDFFHRLF